MPSNTHYTHDIFISYKSEDHAWASRLYADLQARGFKIFLDEQRIQAGAQWENQLVYALRNSQHLVVLWTGKADDSEWVRREIANFEAIINNPDLESAPNRRMIFILLEGKKPAYGSIQMINDLKKEEVYAAGVDELDPNLWEKVINKVAGAVASDDISRPVLLAIIAMTEERLREVNENEQPPGGFKNLKDLLADLSIPRIGTKADLLGYYGDHQEDWQPFGSSSNIWTIMDTLKNEINKLIPTTPIRWELIGKDFWSDDFETAQQEAGRLASEWSVIVIDPLSFYDADIRYRHSNYLFKAFENPKAVFMTLPPFEMLTPHLHFRDLIRQMATQVFERFHNPPILTDRRGARCNVNLGNKQDIKRWLLITVGAGMKMEQPELQSEFLHL